MAFLVSEGSSSTKNELLDFFGMDVEKPTDSAFNQQRAKLKPDTLRAFCEIADRHPVRPGSKNVYIGDQGYCSHNNMAHVMEKQQYFLFRTKDIHSKELVGGFDFPQEESFDFTVNVALTRSSSSEIQVAADSHRRFVDRSTSFDFIGYGSRDTYRMEFRVVRFPIADGVYECVVTNLPKDEFPPERLKQLYFSGWSIETSFRKLKYTVGLSNFHAYRSEYVGQEIWARLITYNITETLVSHTVIEKKDTKHAYKVSFSVAAHIRRTFLCPAAEKDPIDVTALLQKELIPIRNERQYARLKIAHFRKPRYFIYRAAYDSSATSVLPFF